MSDDMSEALDLLYVVGAGSAWRDNELRYSLRSIETNLPHDRVFVAGKLPKFLKDVIHLPIADSGGDKIVNVIQKLRKACLDARLGDRFILMNDDFFVLRPVERILPCHRGFLADSIRSCRERYYLAAMRATQDFLWERGVSGPLDYSLHRPFVLDKRKALAVSEAIGDRRLLFRTIYGNLEKIGGARTGDVKLRGKAWKPSGDLFEAEMISTDDEVVRTPEFQAWIASRFPRPSRYETDFTE